MDLNVPAFPADALAVEKSQNLYEAPRPSMTVIVPGSSIITYGSSYRGRKVGGPPAAQSEKYLSKNTTGVAWSTKTNDDPFVAHPAGFAWTRYSPTPWAVTPPASPPGRDAHPHACRPGSPPVCPDRSVRFRVIDPSSPTPPAVVRPELGTAPAPGPVSPRTRSPAGPATGSARR
ncbi:MAG: hypothetical protein K2X82_01450 [Gemmataceae bacterium]|nr:hypothetical protein [Gemmataceae bacterium]